MKINPRLIAAIAGAVGGWGGYSLKALQVDAAARAAAVVEAKRAAQVAKRDQAAAVITSEAGHAARESQARIEVETKTLIERIPVYVADLSACPALPASVVGLHDAATSGDLSHIPDAAARTDDPARAVETPVVLTVIVENYGICRANAERHNGLIDWFEAQARLAGE